MTWLDDGHLLAALVALLAGALVGWFVPRLIAVLPEPDEDEAESEEEASDVPVEPKEAPAPKPLYVDLAARPHLAAWLALASGLGAAIVGASIGPEWTLLFLAPMVPVCAALAYIDARTRLLPTRLVRPLHALVLVVAAGVAFATDDTQAVVRGLICMVAFRSFFWILWWARSAGMGFGDVRLVALLSFALGYLGRAEVVAWIYAALLIFSIPALITALVRWDRTYLKSRVPFGPALILGALVGVAFGPWIATSLGY